MRWHLRSRMIKVTDSISLFRCRIVWFFCSPTGLTSFYVPARTWRSRSDARFRLRWPLCVLATLTCFVLFCGFFFFALIKSKTNKSQKKKSFFWDNQLLLFLTFFSLMSKNQMSTGRAAMQVRQLSSHVVKDLFCTLTIHLLLLTHRWNGERHEENRGLSARRWIHLINKHPWRFWWDKHKQTKDAARLLLSVQNTPINRTKVQEIKKKQKLLHKSSDLNGVYNDTVIKLSRSGVKLGRCGTDKLQQEQPWWSWV